MSFLRALLKPDGEFASNSLARMAGWVIESADDPEFFIVVALACAALCILWLIVLGIGAAASEIAADVFSRDSLQGLGVEIELRRLDSQPRYECNGDFSPV